MKIMIDDKEVDTEPGQTILEVARINGIYIPTLCYHPALKPFGACRLCSVEIEKHGRKRVVTACNYPVEEGLEVRTNSPEIIEIRKMLIELLLARCPEEKRIQEFAHEYGVSEPHTRFTLENEHCILCGLCARVCEELVGVSAINFIGRGVERKVGTPYEELSDDCIGCGSCALVCPTDAIRLNRCIYPTTPEDITAIEERYLEGERDEYIGVHSALVAGKSSLRGQDGGMVTALLTSGIENGLFDAALIVRRISGYKSEAVITADVEEIKEASGTKYLRVPMIPKIEEALHLHSEWKRIAVVGTPCEVRAVRKLQQRQQLGSGSGGSGNVEVTLLGLFCFESFDYEGLKDFTRTRFGIELDEAAKTQISHRRFIIASNGREYSCDVGELASHVREGCAFCTDFVSRLADISIGSVGSPDGYSTVIVRSKKGEKLLEMTDYRSTEVNKHEIVRVARLKQRNANRNLGKIVDGLK